MKILIDMNLSPDWVEKFDQHEIDSIHWSKIGEPDAEDITLMKWASENHHIIFTHDLDFGTLLRITGSGGPSVIQVRTQDVSVSHLGNLIISALSKYKSILEKGALIIVDENTLRTRILPLEKDTK